MYLKILIFFLFIKFIKEKKEKLNCFVEVGIKKCNGYLFKN